MTLGTDEDYRLLPDGLRYRLVLPDGWTRLPANPVALRPAARQLLTERFKDLPRDRTAQLRRELEDELVQLADTASDQFAVDLLLLELDVDGRPVSGSCVVSLAPVPLEGSEALARLAQELREGALASEVITFAATAAVRVVREESTPAPPVTPGQAAQVADAVRDLVGPQAVVDLPPSTTCRLVDVYLPVPDAQATLLLSFSTRVRPLFDPLTELFTAMAGTVQFSAADTPWR